MKPLFTPWTRRHIGSWALAAWVGMAPAVAAQDAAKPVTAPVAAPVTTPVSAVSSTAVSTPAGRGDTLVGYNRSIRQQDFAGLSKATVLRMQQQLEAIYHELPDWQRDFALREHPLNDGIVGPVTLSWLQRYGYNFKAATGATLAADLPPHMERMAAFALAHPPELDILLSKEFDEWDAGNDAAARERDYAVRRAGQEQPLIDLVNRFRASRTAPPAALARTDDGAYYYYLLTAKDFDLLGAKDQINDILAKFKDKPFASKEALKVALENALDGRDDVLNRLWPMVDKTVRAFDGFLINAATLARLKQDGMSAVTLGELAGQGTLYLKSREAFDTFITDKATAGELTISDEEVVQLAAATKVFDNYHLDQQALDTLQNRLRGGALNITVPPAVVKMLKQIEDVDYSDGDIFDSAARSKLAFGLGMCKFNTPVNNAYVKALAISKDELAALRKDLEAVRLPSSLGRAGAPSDLSALFTEIATLRERMELCPVNDKNRAEAIVEQIYQTYLHTAVDSVARKKIPDTINPIKIKGGDCGCALDDLSGVVYGFYPYWLTHKGTQTVNFRMINRMAYYGLTVDNTGELRLGTEIFDLTDGSASTNDFVRTAHQYNSKVDWLIGKNDWNGAWKTLNTAGKKAVFKRLLSNINTLLNAPLTNLGARIKRVTNFGLSDPPRRGDGVTLYFPNYPDDPEATTMFNDFYLSLRSLLHENNLWLNILVSQDTLTLSKNGAFGLGNLIKLRQKRGAAEPAARAGRHDNDEYLLVLLDEPSADAKKALRMEMENDAMLHGVERADFLRSILPVLHFDDHNWQQLEDDIVYSRDNFGGLGLWAPNFDNLAAPVKDANASCLQSQQIALCLLKNYRDETVNDSLPGPVEMFACANRWALQWTMLALVLAGIALAVLSFTFCKVQNFIKKYFLWVQLLLVLPALLIFVMLLLYDPYLLALSHGNLPFFVSAGIIMVGVGVGYRFWRAQRQVPQRERGIPLRQGMGFPIVVWKIENDRHGFHWLINNRGSGYAIIKKVEILLDGNPVADAKTALESVIEPDNHMLWKSVPLVGQKLEAGKTLAGLTITDMAAATAFEQKLREHDLTVKITYSGPNNEHWMSDGTGIMAVAGVA